MIYYLANSRFRPLNCSRVKFSLRLRRLLLRVLNIFDVFLHVLQFKLEVIRFSSKYFELFFQRLVFNFCLRILFRCRLFLNVLNRTVIFQRDGQWIVVQVHGSVFHLLGNFGWTYVLQLNLLRNKVLVSKFYAWRSYLKLWWINFVNILALNII